MKSIGIAGLLSLVLGCVGQVPLKSQSAISGAAAFGDTYDLWRKEYEALVADSSNGTYSIPVGETDSDTGEFTPSRIMVLECRLGQEAHLHESFLLGELATNPDVHRILEKSQMLCDRYEITSAASVILVPDRGYVHRTRDGLSPQNRQRIWLNAMSKAPTQPAHSADQDR